MTDFVSITVVVVIIFMVFRWLSASGDNAQSNRQAQNRGRITPRTQTRLVNPEMVEQVRMMFPNIPTAAIHYDLQKTGSVEQTCDNILRDGGTLPMPPVARPSTPPVASTSSAPASGSSSGVATNQSVNGNLVQRFKLQDAVEKNYVPEEPQKIWGDNAEKRQEVFKSRKEYMVLQARKRYLEQQARKAKEAEEAKAKEVESTA
ncbi:hypothetical protein BCR41DRAFT_359414 [Lobosporangium transversale]|uniref:CUE domain-containing protein n=1 Tax=Lobosporangium transversale TaxID=64571 RepID=A0A1Y2GEG0_9FUNG|nr:hypothetical protein BCR41DRAFT_359414 [Lobosporangium transversale]ORZ08559.1 hypothetical protein BCR41DRAFT_359414 [Lobosporangium transversale]|eukprot:XP_021878487.1 hypothetical protein BCR41DRAFT_359414 [Lobosporangium transversale]